MWRLSDNYYKIFRLIRNLFYNHNKSLERNFILQTKKKDSKKNKNKREDEWTSLCDILVGKFHMYVN